MRTAFIEALTALAAADDRIWLVTGDLGYSVLEAFHERFPARYLNAGVAEQNMTGIAAGLASCGKIVFTYSIANFPTLRCFEQIRNDVCYHELPVKIVSVGGGYAYGPQGYTHHGLEDLAVMRSAARYDRRGSRRSGRNRTRDAGRGQRTRPVLSPPRQSSRACRSPPTARLRAWPGDLRPRRPRRDAGQYRRRARVCPRCGREVGGRAQARVPRPQHAHAQPLDAGAIAAAVRETSGIVTVEEHSVIGGLGSAVADVLAGLDEPRKPFRKFGAADRLHREIGSQAYLRALGGDLVRLVRDMV